MPEGNSKETTKHEEGGSCLPRSSPMVKAWEFVNNYLLAIGIILIVIIGSQWPESGIILTRTYFSYVSLALCFFFCGLRTKLDELQVAVKSYKAIAWGILTILIVVPVAGTQITKTIQFATMVDENLNTSESAVVGNVTAIGPTEFAFALQVFFVVPASLSAAAILSLLAGGSFPLAMLLMAVTNVVSVFTVPPMLVWLTDLNSGVNLSRFGILMLVFCLVTLLPTMIGSLLRIVQSVREKVESCDTGVQYTIIILFVLSTWSEVSMAQVEEEFNNIVSMNILIVVGYSSIMHIMFLLLNWIASGFLELSLPVKKTIVITGSHKALSFALKVIKFLSTDVGSKRLMSIVCIIAYLTLLVLDSVIVCKWATITENDEKDENASNKDGKYGTIPQQDD